MNTNTLVDPAMTNAKSQNTGYAGCPSCSQNLASKSASAMARSKSASTAVTSSWKRSDRSADGSGPLPASPEYRSDFSTSATIYGPVAGTTPPMTAAGPSAFVIYHSAGASGVDRVRYTWRKT